eukprot:gnl/TRDRNA2_/TRDRNA2_33254_c0_seq1.p1 gnl/TRDRNA2_/TRDRNA2_33254_c0~~gnl/TRDRNA2_/TRDRNA2_33254_c0_seq1.p1  ORF type:complete len:472 (+),score=44.91 gnl/TRDRNA2_/TRDRNA2_33254_c0_seq1:19-1434(+)
MCSGIVVLLLTCVTEAYTKELVTNHNGDGTLKDELVGKSVYVVPDSFELAHSLFNKLFKASSRHQAELDNTALGKVGHLAISHRGSLVRGGHAPALYPDPAPPASYFTRPYSQPYSHERSRSLPMVAIVHSVPCDSALRWTSKQPQFRGRATPNHHNVMTTAARHDDSDSQDDDDDYGDGTVASTYGEITEKGLLAFAPYYRNSSADVFLDLGSGKGNSLLHFYSLFPQTPAITGIEYFQERHDEAVANIREAFKDAPEPTSDSEYHHGPFHLYCGDMFDARFAPITDQASLIYVANLVFTKKMNTMLSALLRDNEKAIVISNKQLSTLGSLPTTLDQSFDSDSQGYVWRVHDKRHEDEIWDSIFESEALRRSRLGDTNGVVDVPWGAMTPPCRSYAIHWHYLACAAGVAAMGQQRNKTECLQKALLWDPTYEEAWWELGKIGGGTVDGKYYSRTDCFRETNFDADYFGYD